jgi:hypothetical protein
VSRKRDNMNIMDTLIETIRSDRFDLRDDHRDEKQREPMDRL